jgi:hypothetical protein
MQLTDSLLIELHALFYGAFALPVQDQDDFIRKNRKKLKILIETLAEQLVETYFGSKPKNIPTAVLLINTHISTLLDADDARVIGSLGAVLKHYEVLADKSYINHKPKLEPLLRNEIKSLCINIVLHPKLRMNQHAAKLRGFLNEG